MVLGQRVAVLAFFAILAGAGCGGGGGTGPQRDATPPAAVTDLAAVAQSDSSIALTWTSPGDDGTRGTASVYDVRRSFQPITEDNWSTAHAILGEPAPGIAGTHETFTVTSLLPDTAYYFALKSGDDIPNWAPLSNCVSESTEKAADKTPPAAVTNLAAQSITPTSVVLVWTAPGDDGSSGTAVSYDVRYVAGTLTEGNWSTATQVSGEPAPQAAGSQQSVPVQGLTPSTLYSFGLRTSDEVPNVSALSNVVPVTTAETPDTVAPSEVTDLTVVSVGPSSVTLTWTAPGDDGATGTAAEYDLRYRASGLSESNWASASQATGEPAPHAAGTPETFTVTGLAANTNYCFALRTADESENESGHSNVPCAETNTAPTASLTVTPQSAVVGTVLLFDGTSSSDAEDPAWVLRFRWDWENDGVFDHEGVDASTVNRPYAVVGVYEAVLEVVDTRGLSDRDTVTVYVTAVPDTAPPSAVSDLTVTAVGATSIDLRWTAPGDDGSSGTAAGYDVRYATSTITKGSWDAASQASGEPAPSVAGSQETFSVTGLTAGTTYYVALRTGDDAGNWSGLSNVVSGRPNTAPVAAFTVTPSPGTTAAALAFDASPTSDAEDSDASLDFHWDWENDGHFDEVFTGTTLASHGFSQAGTYEVVLRVVDPGDLEDRDTVSVVVTDGIAPAAVTNLAAGQPTVSSIRLTWTAPGDDGSSGTAAAYDIRYSTATITSGTWASATPVASPPTPLAAGSSESYTVAGLAEETVYYFALKARDEAANTSGLSNVASDTTASSLVPPEVVRVPHGVFTMGDGVAYCGLDEHAVTLTHDFDLGRYEVTNEEYMTWLQWAYDHSYVTATSASVLDHLDGSTQEILDLDDPDCEIRFASGTFSLRDAGHGLNPSHPVKEVTWYGAAAFCDWLNLREGLTRAYDHATWTANGGNPYGAQGYRLPTDAEWEFAAQYDNERIYPWGDTEPTCSQANYSGCTTWTLPVGSYAGAPVILGQPLYDMAGNVWEWCNDFHDCGLGTSAVVNPVGPATGQRRVLRGGAWEFFTFYPRVAYRSDSYPDVSYSTVGLRVARTAQD